ncbi:hypothetical protein RB195_024358 [Necator americanus]|uniref:Uncharacterized protein n=1 Tax=Necator americanus TaxID=51031 RepID=A0ABR1EMU5_NECAM
MKDRPVISIENYTIYCSDADEKKIMQLAFLHFEAAFDSPLLNVLRDEVPRKFVSSFGVILVPSGYPLIDLELAVAYGLRLRSDECKQLWASSRPRTGTKVKGQSIELVDEYCYLSCTPKNGSY